MTQEKRLSKAGYLRLMDDGAKAHAEGKGSSVCPFPGPRSMMRCAWLAGWYDAQDKAENPRAGTQGKGE